MKKTIFYLFLLCHIVSIDLLMAQNVADDTLNTITGLGLFYEDISIIPGNYILRMTSKDGMILSTSQLVINQF